MLDRYSKAEHKTSFWMIRAICNDVLKSMKPLQVRIKKTSLRVGFHHSFWLPEIQL